MCLINLGCIQPTRNVPYCCTAPAAEQGLGSAPALENCPKREVEAKNFLLPQPKAMLDGCNGSNVGMCWGSEGLASSRQPFLAAECISYWLCAGPWPSSDKILLMEQKIKSLVNTSNDLRASPASKADDGLLKRLGL